MSCSAGSIIARASSGSRLSINSVEPLISANSAVTVLRSPSGSSAPDVGDGATETVGRLVGPAAVAASNCAPQPSQNLAVARLSAPHFAQRILLPPTLVT